VAEQEFKIDTGNKIFMGLSILVLVAAVAFLVYHLVNFAGQLALGERELAPELVETVDQRIAPVGRVEVAAVDLEVAPDEPQAPAEVYQSVCAACHTTGAAGAPRLDDTQEWTQRLDEKGLDTLVSHSINGFQGMPARGGDPTLSDEEVTGAVEYILAEAGLEVTDVTEVVAAKEAPVAAEPAPVAGDVDAGRDRYATCISCHGADGEGQGIFPAVSGQSAGYIADRLMTYRAGEDVGPNSALMIPQAMGLSDEAIADLAAYIATLGEAEEAAVEPEPEVAPEPEVTGDAGAGEGLYAACASCHGAGGEGAGIFPGIAGQSTDYLADRLTTYRAGEEVGPNSALMIPHASGLSDQDIADLAAYIESL